MTNPTQPNPETATEAEPAEIFCECLVPSTKRPFNCTLCGLPHRILTTPPAVPGTPRSAIQIGLESIIRRETELSAEREGELLAWKGKYSEATARIATLETDLQAATAASCEHFKRTIEQAKEIQRLEFEAKELRQQVARSNGELPVGQDLIAERDTARARLAEVEAERDRLRAQLDAKAGDRIQNKLEEMGAS